MKKIIYAFLIIILMMSIVGCEKNEVKKDDKIEISTKTEEKIKIKEK